VAAKACEPLVAACSGGSAVADEPTGSEPAPPHPAVGSEPALSAVTMAAAARLRPRVAPAVVLVFDETLVPGSRVARAHGLVRTLRRGPGTYSDPRPFRRVTEIREGVSLVCAPGPGAPVAAITVEFLAAFGVRRIIAVGTAGDLHGAASATAVPVGLAVSDEGTSKHYGADLRADEELTVLLASRLGRSPVATVTTDVPFRHTPDRLARHRSQALVIEMECAAVFAAARTFDIRAAALLVVADRFSEDTWHLPDGEATRRELARTIDVAADVLSR
jgi:uridine phosphorylase